MAPEPPEAPEPDPFVLGWRAWLIVTVLLVAPPFACSVSQAAELTERGFVLTPDECKVFGELLEQAADARDAGIGARFFGAFLQRRFLRRGAIGSERLRDVLLREVRLAHQSGLDGALLGIEGYTRCMSGPLGGRET